MLTRLRPARPDDLVGIHRLLAACALPTGGVEVQLTEGYVVVEAGAARDVGDAGAGLGARAGEGAEEGAPIVGVCGVEVHGTFGLLRSLAVSPVARGRSTGRALVEDRLGWARARGLRAVYLLTTDADRYFERFGFRRLPRDGAPPEITGCLEFRSLCPETAVVMSIPLGNQGRP